MELSFFFRCTRYLLRPLINLFWFRNVRRILFCNKQTKIGYSLKTFSYKQRSLPAKPCLGVFRSLRLRCKSAFRSSSASCTPPRSRQPCPRPTCEDGLDSIKEKRKIVIIIRSDRFRSFKIPPAVFHSSIWRIKQSLC